MRVVTRLASALLALLFLLPFSKAAAEESVAVSAKGAILLEASSGRVLYEKNADARMEQASTTKIMTAILAIESGGLDRTVTVSNRAARSEGSSLNLKEGETLPLIELLYGLMLQSGNDAAVAIAEALGGSVEAFVERMNEKASLLGLSGTHFANPNGLHDPEHYTTARDLAALSRYAMQNDTFRTIVSTVSHATENCDVQRFLRNKNRLLREYDGATGIKTGYTKAAGKCLAFSAKRDNMELIGAVLNAPRMWDDAEAMLEYGFSTYELVCVASADKHFTVSVTDGEKNSLPAAVKTDILYPIRKDGSESLSTSVSMYDPIAAPAQSGQQIGTVRVSLNGEPIAEAPILLLEDAPKRSYGSCLLSIFETW